MANKAATRFVQSNKFETIWVDANRGMHNAAVRVLIGHGRGAVEVNGGTVTLDVGTAVETVEQDLVDAGLSPAEEIPDVNGPTEHVDGK
ncbi:hypothetical protein [Kitasatospora purpeofusca]|uniref:Uncharacterized protein n=1 Tax=Kitasatospora purpeofusca TaxID=67352 RepID=A0ABZ1UAI8_9ACTN|nr:hypothetical protein [Kitasatospora purpeofusca]